VLPENFSSINSPPIPEHQFYREATEHGLVRD
jgi:hypothetical protein